MHSPIGGVRTIDEPGWVDRVNGAAVADELVSCSSGYHRSAAVGFTCSCVTHGSRCAEIANACDSDGGAVCSAPAVDFGIVSMTGWSNNRDASVLDHAKMACNAGYHRTLTNAFTCDCAADSQACVALTGACYPNQCTAPTVAHGAYDETDWVDLVNGWRRA